MNDSLALQRFGAWIQRWFLYTFVGGNKPSLDGVHEYRLEAVASPRWVRAMVTA